MAATDLTDALEGLKSKEQRRRVVYWTAAWQEPDGSWKSHRIIDQRAIRRLSAIDVPAGSDGKAASLDMMEVALGGHMIRKGPVVVTKAGQDAGAFVRPVAPPPAPVAAVDPAPDEAPVLPVPEEWRQIAALPGFVLCSMPAVTPGGTVRLVIDGKTPTGRWGVPVIPFVPTADLPPIGAPVEIIIRAKMEAPNGTPDRG